MLDADIDRLVTLTISEQMGMSVDDITAQTRLEDLGVESMDLADILIVLEAQFGREVSAFTREDAYFASVGDIIAMARTAFRSADGAHSCADVEDTKK